jgi:hypothetical protein
VKTNSAMFPFWSSSTLVALLSGPDLPANQLESNSKKMDGGDFDKAK